MLGSIAGPATLAVLAGIVGAQMPFGPDATPNGRPILLAQAGDPCGVIDDAGAARALGGAVLREDNPQSLVAGTCAWHSAVVAGDGLTVAVDPGGEAKFNLDLKQISGTSLVGLGDAAYAFVSVAGFVQLGMMIHGTYVTIVLELQSDPQRLARAEDLARVIAGRL